MQARRLVMGATALALVLAACGGGGADTPANGGQQSEQGQHAEGSISVQAQEYEFTGVPDAAAAGEVTFELENIGEEPHELQLVRITSDLPVEEIVGLPQDEAMENIQPVGATFAEPGQSAEFDATLEAGRYGYVCFVQAPDGEPHAAKGMFGEFTVE